MKVWMADAASTALLRACLAEEGTLRFLREWEGRQQWEDLDDASLRLIPYLFRTLERNGIESRYQARIKGTYARYWYLYHRDIAPGLEALRSAPAGLGPPLILKGLPLQSLVYGSDPPTRPVKDIDILVAPVHVPAWITHLESLGYVAESPYSLGYGLRYRKSAGYRSDRSSIDLNWRIHEYSADPSIEARMMARSQFVGIAGQSLQTLDATDHLLHTLLHGSAWNPVPPTRWVLDAALLIRGGAITWGTFIDEADRCDWRSPIVEMLDYLSSTFEVEIPAQSMASLRSLRPRVAGVASHFALTRRSRWSRRACRLLYAEALNDRPRSGSRLAWMAAPSTALVRMGQEFVATQRKPHAG